MEEELKGLAAYYCPSCRCAVQEADDFCRRCEMAMPPLGWPRDLYIGRLLGRKYRLDKRISAGGFGIVFLATQLHENIEIGKVIIKILHPEYAFEPSIKERFINEVMTARSIVSPHVVKVLDLDFDQGVVPFIVQEYVEGKTLASYLSARKRLQLDEAVSIAMQVAEGMREVHKKGIIHRDLKPDNIILQKREGRIFAKLIDFGIARLQSASTLATDSLVGTPPYMSPEQIEGKPLDRRSDIFALGVILFEMALGEWPVRATTSESSSLNLAAEFKKLTALDPSLPKAFYHLVCSMLQKDPQLRPPDMEAVFASLAAIADQQGWPVVRPERYGGIHCCGKSPREMNGTCRMSETEETETETLTETDTLDEWRSSSQMGPASAAAHASAAAVIRRAAAPPRRRIVFITMLVGAACAVAGILLVCLLLFSDWWGECGLPPGSPQSASTPGADAGGVTKDSVGTGAATGGCHFSAAACAKRDSASSASPQQDLPVSVQEAPATAGAPPERSISRKGSKKPAKKKREDPWTKI